MDQAEARREMINHPNQVTWREIRSKSEDGSEHFRRLVTWQITHALALALEFALTPTRFAHLADDPCPECTRRELATKPILRELGRFEVER